MTELASCAVMLGGEAESAVVVVDRLSAWYCDGLVLVRNSLFPFEVDGGSFVGDGSSWKAWLRWVFRLLLVGVSGRMWIMLLRRRLCVACMVVGRLPLLLFCLNLRVTLRFTVWLLRNRVLLIRLSPMLRIVSRFTMRLSGCRRMVLLGRTLLVVISRGLLVRLVICCLNVVLTIRTVRGLRLWVFWLGYWRRVI